jgi:hypothetical protein
MAEDVTVGRLELLGRRAFLPDIEIIQKEYLEGNPGSFFGRLHTSPPTDSSISADVCFGFGHAAFSTRVTYIQ